MDGLRMQIKVLIIDLRERSWEKFLIVNATGDDVKRQEIDRNPL